MIELGANAGGPVSWIVINTHRQKERFAVENLNRQQFVGYCPMLLKRIPHARRGELVSRPMFPAYVFAGLHAGGQRWRPILSTSGVCAILRSGEVLHFLPRGFVEALRACEVDGKIVAPQPSGESKQQVTGVGTDHMALVTGMVEMGERERLLALFRLAGSAAEATGVGLCTQGSAGRASGGDPRGRHGS